MNLAICYRLSGLLFLVEHSMSTSGYYYTISTDNATDYLIDYGYPQYTSECSSDVITSSYKAKVLSPDSVRNMGYLTSQWTIIPAHSGGVVAISMLEYTIGADIFQNQCGDMELFERVRNSTTKPGKGTWCRQKRLLPCVMTLQMAFYMGYVLTSAPGSGVEIVHNSFPDMYEYGAYDKYFSLYYYECGGRRSKGNIRSPVFPMDKNIGSSSQRVSCKWQLELRNSSDYGILRFSRFNLPDCNSHYLLIEEDTAFREEDVSDDLLQILENSENPKTNENLDPDFFSSSGDGEHPRQSNDVIEGGDEKHIGNEDVPTKAAFNFNGDTMNKEHCTTYFYRENAQEGGNVTGNRSGIHAVVITKYCGSYKPPRTKYWRRGSKNVTLTYVANMTSAKQGFEAKYSGFSWKDTMKDHQDAKINPQIPRSFAMEALLNYVGLIVFVPLGTVIGLTIIIYHIKTSGPTLRDFYKKEKREQRMLKRANTERIKSNRPQMKHIPTRRTKSLDMPTSSMPRHSNAPMHGRGRTHRIGGSKFPPTIVEEESFLTKSRCSGLERVKTDKPLLA